MQIIFSKCYTAILGHACAPNGGCLAGIGCNLRNALGFQCTAPPSAVASPQDRPAKDGGALCAGGARGTRKYGQRTKGPCLDNPMKPWRVHRLSCSTILIFAPASPAF